MLLTVVTVSRCKVLKGPFPVTSGVFLANIFLLPPGQMMIAFRLGSTTDYTPSLSKTDRHP